MKGLLDVIAMGEANRSSPHGEYGGMYSGIKNALNVAEMTIGQLKSYQKEQVAKGAKSSAAGRYQIINKSLPKYMQAANLTDDDMFSPENQDLMVSSLINKRAGDDPERIADLVANEFASVQNKNGVGNYDGKLNKATIERSAILNAVKQKDTFDPDAYLAQKTANTDSFDPDAYLSEIAPQQAEQPIDDGYSLSSGSMDNLQKNGGDLATGLMQGAADIGDTIINASSYIPRKIGSMFGDDTLENWNANRGKGLEDFNAQNNNGFNTAGRIISNISGTAGVGNVLALGAKALNMHRTAHVLKSGGFSLGAAKTNSVVANTAMRAAGGGASGAASTLAVSPNETGSGAAWGAAIPAVGMVVAKVAGAVGKSLGGINDRDLAKLAMEKYNIPLSYANITDSNFMKSLRSVLNDTPLASMVGQNQEAVQTGFNREIGKLIGTNSDSITEDVVNANKQRLGSNYNKVYGNNDLKLTSTNIENGFNMPESGFLDSGDIPNNAYYETVKGEKIGGGQGKSLLAEIRSMGGINLSEIRDILGEKTAKAASAQVGMFKKAGLGTDDLAEQLAAKGFIPSDEMDFDGGVRYLKDEIRNNVGKGSTKTYAMDDIPYYSPDQTEIIRPNLKQEEIPNYFDDMKEMSGRKVLDPTQLSKSMQAMRLRAKDLADPQQEANFNRVVDNLISKSENGKVTGKQFNLWQSNLRSEIASKKGYEKSLLNDLRQTTLKYFNDGVSKADKELLSTTNKQYKATKTIEDLVTKGEANVAGRKEGDIPAALLSQAVAKNYKGGVQDSPFADLVKIGQKYIADRVVKTGGGQRAAIQSTASTSGVIGFYVNPLIASAVASGAISINKLLGSPSLAKLMVKKNLNKLENAELQKQIKNKELYKQLANAAVVTNAQ